MTHFRALGLALTCLTVACAGPSSSRAIHVDAASPDGLRAPLLAPADSTAPAVLQGTTAEEGPGLDSLIDPVSAPLTFESPLIHTSVRPVIVYHTFPETSVFKGGRVVVKAAQLRWAITDSIQFIATQDGKAELDPGAGSVIADGSGSMDLEAGFKFKVHEDEDSIVSAGFVYQAANGADEVFQGNGNGVWRPFVSGGWATDTVNLLANVGADIPVDGGDESTSIDAHLQVALAGDSPFVPLAEVHMIHYVSEGRGKTPVLLKGGGGATVPLAAADNNLGGADYANLGNSGVDGQTLVTGALGGRWKATEGGSLGVAWEVPLGGRQDVFSQRWTFDWMQHF